jgi:sugar/nucleoside kinase (ribokinase family)
MSPEIVTVGEVIVEFMREERDRPLDKAGTLAGPFPSGAPSNFIDSAARMGRSAGIIGAVGKDPFGDCVLGRLKRDGVDVSRVSVLPDWLTAIAFVTYFSDGSRQFVFHFSKSAAAQVTPEMVDESYLAGTKFLHVTGSALSFSDGGRDACYKAVDLVKRAGGKVSFDPNLRPELMSLDRIREVCRPILNSTDLLLPSGEEVMMFASAGDPEEACRELVEGGVEIVALKKGEAGSTVFTADGKLDVPSFPVTEIDPTGAGDAFGGAFVVGLLEGWDLPEIARFANAVGALATTKVGAMEGICSPEEVRAFMESGGAR